MLPEPTAGTAKSWLTRLRANPDAVAWTERRSLPGLFISQVAGKPPESVVRAVSELLDLLAADAKWEVRKAVADALRHVSLNDFTKTIARLCDDDNTFVRRAAENALNRRRTAPAPADRRSPPDIVARLAQLEKLHGAAAARTAREVGEAYYDELIGATVHEARGILTPLLTALERALKQARRGGIPADQSCEVLKKTQVHVERLSRLIEDMRNYALQACPLCSSERLREILDDAAQRACEAAEASGGRTKNIEFINDVPPEIFVEAAREWMVNAFGNVIKNAYEAFPIKRGRRTRTIEVTARIVDGDEVEVAVRDNGAGMSREDLNDVRRFLPGTTSRKDQGTGFGLPNAHRRIAAHGGSLWIESEEGRGTTVIIILPIRQPAQLE